MVDKVEGIAVACDFRLAVVERRAVLVHDLGDPLITGDDSLDGVGAFYRLDFCD